MENIDKYDLRQLRLLLLNDFEELIKKYIKKDFDVEPSEWLRSKAVRKLMDISPATLQNLRIAGKIRHRKILGSYYYNRKDLQNLFCDEK